MTQKILIADDETYIRLLISQTLEELADQGVAILLAEDGEAALEIIKAEKPRLIFLDVMMPKLNGFEVCNAVKNELGLRDLYVILLTAKGHDLDRQQGEAAGADLYLTKPFDPDELLDKAKEVLGLS
jgi:CheY-like chemotaxis protein